MPPPLCQPRVDHQLDSIRVCRLDSHTTLYDHLEGIDLPTVTTTRWTGKIEETWIYRYLNGLPLRDGTDALLVNWCEVTVSRPDGQVIYHNAFVTRYPIADDTVSEIVRAGRTRWKVENENNRLFRPWYVG